MSCFHNILFWHKNKLLYKGMQTGPAPVTHLYGDYMTLKLQKTLKIGQYLLKDCDAPNVGVRKVL